MLTPGGDMLINMVAEILLYDIFKKKLNDPIWSQYFSNDMIPPFHKWKNPGELLRINLEENGFEDIKIFIEQKDFLYDSWAHCLKSFMAVDPILPKLDIEQKEEYIVDFFFTLKDVFRDCEEPTGEIRMPYKLLVVYASKP